MIKNTQITEIGKLVKPHGINGEIIITTDYDIDFLTIKCVVINIDGINIPFFIDTIRTRGKESYLILLDGIDDEDKAIAICGKSVYVLNEDIDLENDEDGFYANDLIGYKISLSESTDIIGEIIDIEDSTENALFVIKKGNNEIAYIPIVAEFIENISTETLKITMNLPIGLLDLN